MNMLLKLEIHSNKNDERLSRLALKMSFSLLTDVFKKFRNSSLKNYRFCPSHCLSALASTWDTMLNMTKLSLNLFQMLRCIFYLKKV